MLYTSLLVALTVSIFTDGVLILNMWKWFIVPLGARSIQFWHAVGIALFYTSLSFDVNRSEVIRTPERVFQGAAEGALTALILLGIGWIIKTLMQNSENKTDPK